MDAKTLFALATSTCLIGCGASNAADVPAAAKTAPTPASTAAPATAPTLVARAGELNYRPCAAPLPEGCEIAVLEGNPGAPGPFTVRIRTDRPLLVEPHSHPAASRVTVLAGTLNVGFQDTVDKSASIAFEAGDYYVNDGAVHFVWSDAPVVLQMVGTGPWSSTPAGDHEH